MSIFSIGIVAHYSRHDRAQNLSDAVGAEVITVDNGGVGAGANHELCYEWLAETNAPWSIVLEDDAVPCKGFRDQLHSVLRASPTPLLSLFLGRARPPHWQPSIARVITGDHHFLLGSELLHHVGVAVRTDLIGELLGFIRADRDYRKGRLPIDEAIGRYARSTNTPVGYCHPSIVDHENRLPTVITHHLSQHKADTGQRGTAEVRTAWAFGVRRSWQPLTAAIPEPA